MLRRSTGATPWAALPRLAASRPANPVTRPTLWRNPRRAETSFFMNHSNIARSAIEFVLLLRELIPILLMPVRSTGCKCGASRCRASDAIRYAFSAINIRRVQKSVQPYYGSHRPLINILGQYKQTHCEKVFSKPSHDKDGTYRLSALYACLPQTPNKPYLTLNGFPADAKLTSVLFPEVSRR